MKQKDRLVENEENLDWESCLIRKKKELENPHSM